MESTMKDRIAKHLELLKPLLDNGPNNGEKNLRVLEEWHETIKADKELYEFFQKAISRYEKSL